MVVIVQAKQKTKPVSSASKVVIAPQVATALSKTNLGRQVLAQSNVEVAPAQPSKPVSPVTGPPATPPKDNYVPPPPGITTRFDENNELVTRITLRPGEGSNLRWEKTETTPTSQGYELKGYITSSIKTEGIQPTPQKQLRMPGSDIIRNIWYGKQETPEQLWQGPGLIYSHQPSTKQIMAETYTNIGIGLAGGGVVRVAAPAAETATGFLRTVYRGSKVVMAGSVATGVGADVSKTAYDIQNKAITRTMLGYKAIQLGAGLVSFSVGAGMFDKPFRAMPEPKLPRVFKEPASMFENKYIKDIVGYKTKPTVQIKIEEIPGNKYLMTNREMIKLESTGLRTPTIRTTMTERPMELLGLNKNISPVKTTQLSVYGAKVYEKPTTPLSYPSKVPWRFESMTQQTKLQPTNTWIDIRFENGRLVTKEIPYEKVRFFEDTRAEQSLMLLRERPTKPLFRSEIYTKMEEAYKPSSLMKFGLLRFPAEKQLTYTGQFDIPVVKSASLDAMMYGELQKQKQDTNMVQKLRDMTKQRDEQSYLPASLQVQKQEQQSQIQKQDMIFEQVMKTQDKTVKDSITRFAPGFFRLPGESTRVVSEKSEQEGFNVFIKDRTYVHGKKKYAESWKKANTTPLSEHAALSLGATAVDQSAAASFKIRPTEGKAKPLKIGVDPWDALSSKFYKNKDIYIESTNNRIDSHGEIKGISALGWIASQKKTYQPPASMRLDFKAPPTSKSIRASYDIDFSRIMRGLGL